MSNFDTHIRKHTRSKCLENVTVHSLSETSVWLKIKVKIQNLSNESTKIMYISNVK